MVWSSVFSRAHHPHHENPEPHPSSSSTFESATMEDAVSAAEEVVLHSTTLFDESSNRDEAIRFLSAVADLQRAMHLFVGSKDRHGQEVLGRAHRSTQAAMARLQNEFYQLLSANRHSTFDDVLGSSHCSSVRKKKICTCSTSESSYHHTPGSTNTASALPQQLISDLRSIAESMVKCGHGKECFKAYEVVRRSAVDEALFRLGFPRISPAQSNHLGTSTSTTEHSRPRLKSWPHAARKGVRSLFSAERALCDGVFGFADDIRESAFGEIAGEGATHLFAFPETAAKAVKKSPEKMFELLEAYSAIVELIPELDRIFAHGYTGGVKVQAASSLEKLAEAVRFALAEFEDAVHKYASSKGVPVPGGAIHPLTRYAMNYLAFLADYGLALSEIFADYPLPPHKPLPENFFFPPTPLTSPPHPVECYNDNDVVEFHGNVASHVAWLVLVILCRLDGEAGFYKDNVPLAYLFLANNLTYIINKVRSSGLRRLLDSHWVTKQEDTARNYAKTYQKLAWKEVAEAIPRDPSRLSAAEAVRRFSAAFEDACRRQAGWVVPDDRMREELKESIAEKVVTPYAVLYEAWRGDPVVARAVRFAPQDVENYLSDLFQGGICFTFPASGVGIVQRP